MTSPKLTAVTIISVAFQFSLSVLCEGGPTAYFSHPPLVALAIVTAALTVASLFTSGNLSPGEREDRDNRWVLAAFSVIMILTATLPAYTDRKHFWTFDWGANHGDTVRWLGIVLFAAGGVLRIWPVFTLGRRFSGLVAIQPGHTLVTTGIYRTIRNPSYLGLLISTLGWGLAFRSGVGVILTALILPPLIARMNAEERLLHAQFGAEYDAYRARTARLIPGLY